MHKSNAPHDQCHDHSKTVTKTRDLKVGDIVCLTGPGWHEEAYPGAFESHVEITELGYAGNRTVVRAYFHAFDGEYWINDSTYSCTLVLGVTKKEVPTVNDKSFYMLMVDDEEHARANLLKDLVPSIEVAQREHYGNVVEVVKCTPVAFKSTITFPNEE